MKLYSLLFLLLAPATQVPCQTSGCPVGSTVATIGAANVRATCSLSGTILKLEPAGAQGVVTSGPVPTSSNFDYIGVKFADGITGCVGDDNTTLVTAAPPPSQSPIYTITAKTSDGVLLFTVVCSATNGVYTCK